MFAEFIGGYFIIRRKIYCHCLLALILSCLPCLSFTHLLGGGGGGGDSPNTYIFSRGQVNIDVLSNVCDQMGIGQ